MEFAPRNVGKIFTASSHPYLAHVYQLGVCCEQIQNKRNIVQTAVDSLNALFKPSLHRALIQLRLSN